MIAVKRFRFIILFFPLNDILCWQWWLNWRPCCCAQSSPLIKEWDACSTFPQSLNNKKDYTKISTGVKKFKILILRIMLTTSSILYRMRHRHDWGSNMRTLSLVLLKLWGCHENGSSFKRFVLFYFKTDRLVYYIKKSYFPRRDLREAGRRSENRTLTDSTEERCWESYSIKKANLKFLSGK